MTTSSTYDSLSVLAVPAFQDNYLWLICRGNSAVAVDPGDAAPVEAALREHKLALSAIVLTHHHQDHIGGVGKLRATRPGIPIYGPRDELIAGVTNKLTEGNEIYLESVDLALKVIDVPGHTSGHIAYFGVADGKPVLFCGDTLFGGGCGRLFEGTAEQMQNSLAKLSSLPAETLVYCAHEYTVSNLRFASAVEPANDALKTRIEDAGALRASGQPTLPSTIGLELQTNPFLRWDSHVVQAAAERLEPGAASTAAATFAAIRSWKDRF